jgi:hypothetical protein
MFGSLRFGVVFDLLKAEAVEIRAITLSTHADIVV